MNDNLYIAMIQDIATQNANLTIEKAEYKARLSESLREKEEISGQLEHFKDVLSSDPTLKELFEEVEKELITKDV